MLLFGIDCRFSTTVLAGILELNLDIVAICLPGPPSFGGLLRASPPHGSLILLPPDAGEPSIFKVAITNDIPVYRAGGFRQQKTIEDIRALEADLLLCACFTRLVPRVLYEHLPLGSLNLHPSLLPDKRGPDPVFWTLKEGTGEAAMTIHRLSRRFDAGDVLSQKQFSYPDGITEPEFDSISARHAVTMLSRLLPGLLDGSAKGSRQQDADATHAPFPSADDFSIDRSRPARAAFNFVRGIAGRGKPILTEYQGATERVVDAVAYYDDPRDAEEWERQPDVALIECSPGTLVAKIAPIG